MHVVVIGAGAIGTLYGGWLLAAGAEVSFLARGRRLQALREHGLTIDGDGVSFRKTEVSAADAVSELRRADVILFTVKLYDLARAAAQARELLAPDGLVVGLQNGVDAADILAGIFAPAQVMVGPVYSAASLGEDGVARYSGARNDLVIGIPTGAPHPLAIQLIDLWCKAGVDARIAEDIRTTLWTKFLAFGTNAALTCLTRQAAGVVYHDSDLLGLAARSIDEIAAVAKAEGAVIPATATADAIALLQSFPADMVASMRQDLDAGRRLELDGVSGAIARYGRKHGIATPFHDTAYACLKPYRDGRTYHA